MRSHLVPRAAAALLVALTATFDTGCVRAPQPGPEWPEGTVLALDDEPILASEVDAEIAAILDIQQAFVETQRRRLVLINLVLPRTYARTRYPERREQARVEADDWDERFLEGNFADAAATDSEGTESVGNWDEIGLDVWLVARKLRPGESSSVVELPGRFAVIELLQRDDNPRRSFERMLVRVHSFEFVNSTVKLLDDYLEARLEIVDPAWAEVVPGFLKYKMRDAQ